MNIKDKLLTPNQYYDETYNKKVIVIHHTAGGPNPINVIHGWQFNVERVATAYVIAGKADKTKSYEDGDVFRAFEDDKWAYHLGLKTENNNILNKISIGIELCNWGQLIKKPDGNFYNYINQIVPSTEVIDVGHSFRGFQYYHAYTSVQLTSLRTLIEALTSKYNIPKIYMPIMWDVSPSALAGSSGIWTHVSYRIDKNDCSPQPQLINVLKSLG
jgi:N-acetyl-anhydromuramyl-L-alanine amidase AmpD